MSDGEHTEGPSEAARDDAKHILGAVGLMATGLMAKGVSVGEAYKEALKGAKESSLKDLMVPEAWGLVREALTKPTVTVEQARAVLKLYRPEMQGEALEIAAQALAAETLIPLEEYDRLEGASSVHLSPTGAS